MRKNKCVSMNASKQMLSMGSAYALGTFTDNFYKQVAILVAAASGKNELQSIATVMFSLPFILCSAWAGWSADRFVKKHIVFGAKLTELVSLCAGVFFLYKGFWPGILFVLFFMGMQSTFFSPALNGSIPEVFPENNVPKVNSYIKLASTIAVLAGITAAGFFLDVRPGRYLPSFGVVTNDQYGIIICGIFILCISLLGFISTVFIASRPAAVARHDRGKFPWSGPIASMAHFWETRKDPQLFFILLAEGVFYGVAAIVVICVANLADVLGYSKTMASLLSASVMVGIAIGAVIAGRFNVYSWKKLLVPSAFGMGACIALVALTPFITTKTFSLFPAFEARLLWFFCMLFFAGVCGGLYLIPVASFLQVYPVPEEKGKVLGVSNFFSFVAIAFFGVLFYPLGFLPPHWTFLSFGLFMIVFSVIFSLIGKKFMRASLLQEQSCSLLSFFLQVVLSLRYRVHVDGFQNIKAQPRKKDAINAPILFLPNHPALIDPIIIYSRISGLKPYALVDSRQISGWKKIIGNLFHLIAIPDIQKDGKQGVTGVKKGLESLAAALNEGENALLYPSGKIYRTNKEDLGGNSAVEYLRKVVPNLRIVLIRTTGLWGSNFSYAEKKEPNLISVLFFHLRTLIVNGIFFTPKRRVTVTFYEPHDLPSEKYNLNRRLEAFYNEVQQDALYVPYFFWQGSLPIKKVDEEDIFTTVTEHHFSPTVITGVYRILQEHSGVEKEKILPSAYLGKDLGIDSLSLMEVVADIESEFGQTITLLEKLVTVSDCLAFANGELKDDNFATTVVPADWFLNEQVLTTQRSLKISKNTSSIVHSFLLLVKKSPLQLMMAGGGTKALTRSKVLMSALALANTFKKIPGNRIGIMLPSTPVAAIVWLAAQLAGKEPVMLNWTVGIKNFRSCIFASGIVKIVTASALLNQLKQQKLGLEEFNEFFLPLENITSDISQWTKIQAFLRTWLYCLTEVGISLSHIPSIAVILFTSGSEAAPKGVPLSHKNIMTNVGDLLSMLGVEERDSLLAMLPPFHSFGMLVGIAIPFTTGLRVVYHQNPTESQHLARLVNLYKVTLLGAAPSFLEGMLQKAAGTDTLKSLRLAFVGAEKCPERIYSEFAKGCPQASLCEGYGITECSPVISVNTPGFTVPGTIGYVLPSLKIAIINPAYDESLDDYKRVATGENGLLLVHGASVFSGYIGDAPSPFLHFEGEKWYNTGDLVACNEEGRLTFKGRLKRFVKIGGEMISLPLMEEIVIKYLLEQPDNDDSNTSPIAAIITLPGTEEQGKPELALVSRVEITAIHVNSLLVSDGLSPLYSIRKVIKVDELPVLGTGKTDYRAISSMVL